MDKAISIFFTSCAVLLAIAGVILFWPHYVKIDLVATEDYNLEEYNLSGMLLCLKNKQGYEKQNLGLPSIINFNFDKYNLWLSGEMKILGVRYNYFDRLTNQYGWNKNIYVGKVILDKNKHKDKIFVYRAEKVSIDTIDSVVVKK